MNYYFQILLYNSEKKLPKLLKSFLHLTVPKGSKLQLSFREQSENDRVIKEEKKIIEQILEGKIDYKFEAGDNFGFGKGHNTAYRNMTPHDDVGFFILNPDGMIFDDFLVEFQKFFDQVKDKQWGIIEAHQFPVEHPKHYDPETYETNWASGAATFFNREMFDELEGFDENLFMYGEDVDLSFRARIAGYKLYHAPRVKFIHVSYGLDPEKDDGYINKYIPASELYIRDKYIGQSSVDEFMKKIENHPYRKDILEAYSEIPKPTDEYRGKINIFPDKEGYAPHRWQ